MSRDVSFKPPLKEKLACNFYLLSIASGVSLSLLREKWEKEDIVSNPIWFNDKFVFVFLSSKLAKSFISFEGDFISDYWNILWVEPINTLEK